MSKNGANVLLIFQCPVICPTPSQVDILVSDDSPYSPTSGAVVTNAFHSYNSCWYIRALNNNGNEHIR